MYLLRCTLACLIIAVLLSASGDCVNLRLADGPAMDCCMRDGCDNDRSQAGDCCLAQLPDSAKYFQAEANVSKELFRSHVCSVEPVCLLVPRDSGSLPISHSGIAFHERHAAPDGSLPLLI